LTFKLSMIASTTRSLFFTASALSIQSSVICMTLAEGGTYASVVVVILAMIPFVNSSTSFGLAFLATRESDLVIIFNPFLSVSSCNVKQIKTYWSA
jgi:hypothetical protein